MRRKQREDNGVSRTLLSSGHRHCQTLVLPPAPNHHCYDLGRQEIRGHQSHRCGIDTLTDRDRVNKTGEPLTAWTKLGYKITVRVFWRWMRRCGEDENLPETSWIRTKRTKDSKILPEQLLTKEDVLKIPPQILACPWATQYALNLQRTSTNTNANGGQMNLGLIRFVPRGYTKGG